MVKIRVPDLNKYEFQKAVLEARTNPPSSPAEGARYLINGTGQGSWSGKDNNIATYYNSTWEFTAPREGMIVWDKNTDVFFIYNGTSWVNDLIHEKNKDQYLDYGGANQVSASEVKDAVVKKHIQNTDQYLDYGGTNQVSASEVKDAVNKKHTQNTDQYLDYGGANQVSASEVKDAVVKKHTQNTDQYLDYGGTNQISASEAKEAYTRRAQYNDVLDVIEFDI